MKKEILKKCMDGDTTIHILRNINTIEKEDLKEFGKCMFCSLEHYDKSICKQCKKDWLYEEIDQD